MPGRLGRRLALGRNRSGYCGCFLHGACRCYFRVVAQEDARVEKPAARRDDGGEAAGMRNQQRELEHGGAGERSGRRHGAGDGLFTRRQRVVERNSSAGLLNVVFQGFEKSFA